MTPSLGSIEIDLQRLLETRMLIQSNAGGGKSFCLRRILEQTAPLVQQLVIDPEGEFASLREKHDYIVCAPSGADAVASPHTAAALARALWQARTSAVLDIYELKAHERILFVRRFLEALVNAPRSIWNPALVVIDEAHIFAPQADKAESLGAVIDLASRGRKRGLSLLAATQRISKLHKDCAAELLNKAIGRTGLDVDVRRAADELGISNFREAQETLRNLEPGEFFVFGPALTRSVERTKIGPVKTTHPQTGSRTLVAPPPPSAKVRAQLARIEGLQREAEADQATLAGTLAANKLLHAEIVALKRRIGAVDRAPGASDAEVERRIREALAAAPRSSSADVALRKALEQMAALAAKALGATVLSPASVTIRASGNTKPAASETTRPIRETNTVSRETANISGIRAGAVRILQELAARAPAGYTLAQVGGLTQFSVKGGTFRTYMGDLRRAGLIEGRGNLVHASERGIAYLGDKVPATPRSHQEAMALWRKALRKGAHDMLQAVVEMGQEGMTIEQLAGAVDMEASGGTFRTYVGDLRRNGLITVTKGHAVANDILWPERA